MYTQYLSSQKGHNTQKLMCMFRYIYIHTVVNNVISHIFKILFGCTLNISPGIITNFKIITISIPSMTKVQKYIFVFPQRRWIRYTHIHREPYIFTHSSNKYYTQ